MARNFYVIPWQCNMTCRDNHFSSEYQAMKSIFDRKDFCQLYAETEVCVESFIANTTSFDIKVGMIVTYKRENSNANVDLFHHD